MRKPGLPLRPSVFVGVIVILGWLDSHFSLARAESCTAGYSIDLTVELNSDLTKRDDNVLIELRAGSVGNSKIVDTKTFAEHTGTVVFAGLSAGPYFVDIGNGPSVAVGPVHTLAEGQRIRTRVTLTSGNGNVGQMNRNGL